LARGAQASNFALTHICPLIHFACWRLPDTASSEAIWPSTLQEESHNSAVPRSDSVAKGNAEDDARRERESGQNCKVKLINQRHLLTPE
jgi:hypothetical protein